MSFREESLKCIHAVHRAHDAVKAAKEELSKANQKLSSAKLSAGISLVRDRFPELEPGMNIMIKGNDRLWSFRYAIVHVYEHSLAENGKVRISEPGLFCERVTANGKGGETASFPLPKKGDLTIMAEDAKPLAIPMTIAMVSILKKAGIEKQDDYRDGYRLNTRGRECKCVTLDLAYYRGKSFINQDRYKPAEESLDDMEARFKKVLEEKDITIYKTVTANGGKSRSYYFIPQDEPSGITADML